MSFETLEVRKKRLEAFEGETLKRFVSNTPLGYTDTDEEMASEAKRQTKIDLYHSGSQLVYGGTFDSTEDLLNAMAEVDSDEMIELLMSLKFLELFFGDNSMDDSDNSAKKAIYYESKYDQTLKKVSNKLLADLTPSKQPNRPRFSR